MKLPYMQFYPGDWWRESGLRALDIADRGMWFEMLLTMHESPQRGRLVLPNGSPIPEDSIARMMGIDTPRYRGGLARLIEFGVAGVSDDGVVFCRRMIRDEEKRIQDEKNGQKGWEKRKNQAPPIAPPIKNQIPQGIPLYSESESEEKSVPTSGTPQAAAPELRKRFTVPSAAEVSTYGREIGYEIDGEKFCDFYASKGWLIGKTPMKDWKAAVRTWRSQERSTPVKSNGKGQYDDLPLWDAKAEREKRERIAAEPPDPELEEMLANFGKPRPSA